MNSFAQTPASALEASKAVACAKDAAGCSIPKHTVLTDIHGQVVPRITWRSGLFFGGDNVPEDQIIELCKHGLSKWWTYDRLRYIFDDGTSQAYNISARELKCFATNYMREYPIVYCVEYEGGPKREVDLRRFACNLMALLRRAKLDATMR
jgi:hypothetical protein